MPECKTILLPRSLLKSAAVTVINIWKEFQCEKNNIRSEENNMLKTRGTMSDSGEKIKFGILGCASIARKLVRAMLMTPGVELYAIGSRSLEKAQYFASTNKFPSEAKIYGSYDEVLNDTNVDAVYIPLPTSLHLDWVLKAAEKKKHVLLEKPLCLQMEELATMLEACERNGLQLMDGTMWMHHPRTSAMKDVLSNSDIIGDIKQIRSVFCVSADATFLKEDIRVKSDLDALGALGDVGWYCIRAILWAVDFDMPTTVTAHPGAKLNDSGVLLSCGATMVWEDGKVASFTCSFEAHMMMEFLVHGSKGALRCSDFVIPHSDTSAKFVVHNKAAFTGLTWISESSEHEVQNKRPQESLMVEQFSKLVKEIKRGNGKIDKTWHVIANKTQTLVNAVKESVLHSCSTIKL